MLLTEFGKLVRKYRIDVDVTLREMADELGISAAYLSAIEIGRRPLTDQILDGAVAFFKKRAIDAGQLRDSADRTRRELDLTGLAETDRALVAAFARKVPSMAIERRRRIEKLLWGEDA